MFGGKKREPLYNFENLAVPLGMFQDKIIGGKNTSSIIPNNRTVIGDDIYDRLLELVTPKKHTKTKSTKTKIGGKKGKKTRKNNYKRNV